MNDIGKIFMEQTKYKHLEMSDQQRGVVQPPMERAYDLDKPVFKLPSPEGFGTIPLMDAINNRRSTRKYALHALTMHELSYLLWCTQGVQKVMGTSASLRTVPSAGARHAFETFLLINNTEGLNQGLYRFLAFEHKILELETGDSIRDKIVAGCLGQGFAGTGGATFMWVADAKRMHWRYGERGYRYLHLDAGHICQNLYLAAEAIDCGVCAIAAFDDDAMNEALGLDGEEQFVVYIAALGVK